MKKPKKGKALILLAASAIDLSWMYAIAFLLSYLVLGQLYPPLVAIFLFWLPAIIKLATRGRGLRVVVIVLLNLAGFVGLTAATIRIFGCFLEPLDLLGKVNLALVVLCSMMFWLGGIAFSKRPVVYMNIASRLDIGICVFFFMFLLVALTGLSIDNLHYLLFPFFLFSILAIALSRSQGEGKREYFQGYHGVGLVLAFALVVLLISVAALTFFMPYLKGAAKVGYEIIEVVALPIIPYVLNLFVAFFKMLYGTNKIRSDESAASGDGLEGSMEAVESSWWLQVVDRVVVWGFIGLIALLATGIVLWGVWFLARKLFGRTELKANKNSIWRQLLSLAVKCLALCKAFFNTIKEGILLRYFVEKDAVWLYKKLIKWGQVSGLKALATETPFEYGNRLSGYFPQLRREISIIVDFVNRELYGGMVFGEDRLSANQSIKRLRNPRYWFTRASVLFYQGKNWGG